MYEFIVFIFEYFCINILCALCYLHQYKYPLVYIFVIYILLYSLSCNFTVFKYYLLDKRYVSKCPDVLKDFSK